MFQIKSFKSFRNLRSLCNVIYVDQTPGMRFGVNRFGFLQNDRELLAAAAAKGDTNTVKEIMELMTGNIVRSGVSTTGMSDEQILDTLLPNWASSPADLRILASQYAQKFAPHIQVPDLSEDVVTKPIEVPKDVEPKKD